MTIFKFMTLAVSATMVAAPHTVMGQDWPAGAVKIIVPYAPGSTPDLVARIVADRLQTRLGKPMVVENKPGAAGNIGTNAIAKAVPDGQTIGVSIAGPLGVNSLLFKQLPYDPARDLAFITIAATQPAVLVVSSKMPATDAKQVIELLKKEPGKHNFSSMGAGTISHLGMAALSSRTQSDLTHVPYAGSGPASQAILSGDVDMALLPAATVMPQIKAGKMRGIAVASAKRSASIPDLPTLGEMGFPDVQADAWIGFIAPARTSLAIQERLHDEIVKVLAEPDVREKLRLQYMDVVANSPDEFRKMVSDDVSRWKPVIQKYNVKLD